MGCDGKPAPSPVWNEDYNGISFVYWNCPRNFIPASIYQWWEFYWFYSNHPGANPGKFSEQTSVYIEACQTYQVFKNEYLKKKV